MKKLVLILIGIFAFALSFVPQISRADNTQYSWVDRQTITSPSLGTFLLDSVKIDAGNDGSYGGATSPGSQKLTFKRQNDPDICTDTLEIIINDGSSTNWGSGSATYFPSSPYSTQNSSCNTTNRAVQVDNGGNNYNVLDWVDSATIRPLPQASNDLYGQAGDFVLNPKTNQFVQQGSGTCHSYIDSINSSQTGGALHLALDSTTDIADKNNFILFQNCYQIKDGATIRKVITGSQSHTIQNNILSVSLGNPANFATPGTPSDNPSSGAGATSDKCADGLKSFAWIGCPAFDASNTFLEKIYNGFVVKLLEFKPLDQSPTSPLRSIVNLITALANVFFIVVFLIMIFGTTLNLSSYTIKKTLPRLIIAAVGIQFAYLICGFIVDIGNVLGYGILDLVSSVLNQGHDSTAMINDLIVVAGGLGGAAALAGAFLLLGPVVLLILLALVLAVIAFIFTLLMRKIMITMLIIVAPFAIAAAVLPNTEKYFKKWYQTFIRVIMVFPIISLIISSGVIAQATIKSAGFPSEITPVAGAIVSTIAFFMMPMAFKWGGSAMGIASRIGSKYSGAEAGRKASMQAGKAPIKTAYAGFGKNRAATSIARNNAKIAAGGFGARKANLKAGNGLGTGFGLTTAFSPGRRAASQAVYARNQSSAEAANNAMNNEQIKDYTTSMESQTPENILTAAQNTASSPAQKQAALNSLVSRGDTGRLSTLQESMGHEAFATALARAPKAEAAAAKAAAPHLKAKTEAGASAAYSNISASDMMKLDKTGWSKLNDHVNGVGSTPERRKAFEDNMNKIYDTSGQLNKELRLDTSKYAEIISEGRAMPSDIDTVEFQDIVNEPVYGTPPTT